MAPRRPLSHVVSGWIRVGLAAALLGSLSGVTGCKPSSAGVTRARFEIINASDRAWRIVVAGSASRERRGWTIGAHQTIEAEVPAGVYAIEQTLLTIDGGVAERRHFSAAIEAGESYRWQLTTLLSESP
ncbi:MAG TPA: hypothetical protein VGD81_13525 [Opitutaceae bacterium]